MAHSQLLQMTVVQETTAEYEVDYLVERFIDYGYRVSRNSKWTMRTRASHLRCFARHCIDHNVHDIRSVNHIMLDDFFSEESDTLATSTVNTCRRVVRVFLKWVIGYVEIDLRVHLDTIKLQREEEKLPRALNFEMVKHVIANADNEQDSIMIAFMVETGSRISEVVRVRREDVHGDEVFIHGKGGRERIVHMTVRLAIKIKKHLRKHGDYEYLFEHQDKGWYGQMTTYTARKRLQEVFMRVAGIHVCPHQLRHTMAVQLLCNGCDIMTVKEELGHVYLTTTQVYLRLTNTQRRDSYQRSMPSSI